MFKVAICGKANTGKNTLSNILYNETYEWWNAQQLAASRGMIGMQTYSGKFMAFADPIKEIILNMFPQAKKDCLYGPSDLRSENIPDAFREGQPLTYRQALIDLGSLARGYDDLVWVKNFQSRYDKVLSQKRPPYIVVVTDVRFRNEFDHLKAQGFYQIRLYRETGMPPIEHASETNQSTIDDEEFDCVLFNNRTLDYLKDEVKKIVPKMKP